MLRSGRLACADVVQLGGCGAHRDAIVQLGAVAVAVGEQTDDRHRQKKLADRGGPASWDPRHVAAPRIDAACGAAAGPEQAAVDLYWLPLGAGGCFVRLNGRLFEAAAARAERRTACDLYHSALEVRVAAARFVIEQAPVRDARGEHRGVVGEGPIGTRWAGRVRIFRYEIRRWRDGHIPDVDEAVGSAARRLLDLVPQVPTLVWGRDEGGPVTCGTRTR